MKEDVVVSIICTAYNHEKYIRDALEGFINQQTSVKYEVLINDDASTDNTASIIKEYEEKYPDIVKPVYQKENQYRQGISLTRMLLSKAKGKYFALCEGDDYWIDVNKLQKQVDYMEKHPHCSLCIHNAITVDSDNKKISDIITTNKDRIISTDEVILRKGGFCATNSILGRVSDVQILPSYFETITMDYTWQIYLASCGYTYCLNDYMSVYRVSTPGSWTERMKKDTDAHIAVLERMNRMLESFNMESDNRYNDSVHEILMSHIYEIAIEKGDKSLLQSEEVKQWIRKNGIKKQVVRCLMQVSPKLAFKLRILLTK